MAKRAGAQVRTSHGLIDITAASRRLLLELLAEEGCHKDIAAFEAAGTDKPVELDEVGRSVVASVIIGNADKRTLPTDLIALRQALNAD